MEGRPSHALVSLLSISPHAENLTHDALRFD